MKVNINKTKLIVYGTEEKTSRSKTDPCAMCGKRVIANFIMRTKCRCWIHKKCTKRKKLSVALAQSFKCRSLTAGTVETKEELHVGIETLKDFCYLGDRLNASGASEAAVTATKIGWVKFRERGEVLYGKRFSLRLRGKSLPELCPISHAIRKRIILMNDKRSCYLKNRKIYDKSHVCSEVDGQKKH